MATASKKKNFTQEDDQQDYLPGFLREKRFTLKLMIEAKFR